MEFESAQNEKFRVTISHPYSFKNMLKNQLGMCAMSVTLRIHF